MRTIIKNLGLGAAAMALAAGCAGSFNGAEQALTVAQAHPIAVDSQVVSLTIADDVGADELSQVDKARLTAFADAYLRDGHGPLTVTAPSGGEARGEQEVAADIRRHLHMSGVSYERMAGATYRAGGGGGRDIILTYTQYVATPSACGIWDGLAEAERRNVRSPNFGCAAMNNLAAMVADPRDLVSPPAMTSPDPEIRIRGVNAFRQGEDTSSQVNNEINQRIANQ